MLIVIGVIALFLIIFLLSSMFIVDPGELYLVKNLGSLEPAIYSEGIHFKNPITATTASYNIRTQKVENEATASTIDLQDVGASVAVNYVIDPARALDIFRRIGDDSLLADNVIKPNIQEAIKIVTAKYKANELVTKRSEVSKGIAETLSEKLKDRGVTIQDINITNISFSASFNEAVERTAQAEQNALVEKNNKDKEQFLADQKIIKAKGESEAIRLSAEAIKSQGGTEYVQLKWIEKWNGVLPSTSLGSNVPMVNIK